MKKILFMVFAALVCIFTSCNSNNGTPAGTDNSDSTKTDAKRNLAASDVVMKSFQTGDVSGLDSVLADDFIDHTDMGDKKGKDSLKAMVKFVHNNFSDMKFDKVRDDVADGDYVYSWITYSGTGDGTMGMPKGPYKFGSIEISKFKDGKAVEHWAFMDSQDIAKMMPQQEPAKNKMDAGKKKK